VIEQSNRYQAAWQQVFALLRAVAVGVTAWVRLTLQIPLDA
jgi:hypothetical protein